MSQAVGDYRVSLLLDNKQFGQGLKSSLNMLKVFNTQAKGLMDLTKGHKLEMSGIDKEIRKTEGSLRRHQQEASKSTRAQDQLNNSFKRGGAAVVTYNDRLQNVALRYQGIRSVIQTLTMTMGGLVRMYKEEATANSKLGQGLQNVNATAGAFERLNSLAKEYQATTIYDDTEVKNALAMLTTFMKTEEEMKILLPRILDLAAAYEKSGEGAKDLQQVAVMVGKVNEETIGDLKRVGVAFTQEQAEKLKSLKGTEQAIFLSQILDQNFKGMAKTIGDDAPGKIAQFNNKMGDMGEKFGEVLVNGILPILTPIGQLVDMITDAPPHVQQAVLAFTALGVTFGLLGGQMNKGFLLFGLILSGLLALPPGIRAVIGALVALIGVIVAVNVASGGLTYALGLIAGGLAAIASSFMASGESIQSVTDKLEESADKVEEYQTNLNNLKTVQDAHNKQTVLTKDGQLKYNQALEEVAKIYPEVVDGIKDKNEQESVNITILDALIEREEERLGIQQEINETLLQSTMEKTIEELADVSEEYDELSRQLSNNGKEIKDNYAQWDVGLDILGNVNDEIIKVGEKYHETGKKVKELEGNFTSMIAQGLKMGNLSPVLSNITSGLQSNSREAQVFADALKGVSASAVFALMGISEMVSKSAEVMGLWSLGMSMIESGQNTLGAALLERAKSLAQSMQSVLDKRNAPGNNTTKAPGSSNTGSDKSEEDAFYKQFNLIKAKNELYKETNRREGISNLNAYEQIKALEKILLLEQDEEKLIKKKNDYYGEINRILKEGLFGKLDIKSELPSVDVKGDIMSRFQVYYEAVKYLHTLQNELIDDEFTKRMALLKQEHEERLNNIDSFAVDDALKNQMRSAEDERYKKAVEDSTVEFYSENLSVLHSAANQIGQILNLAADSTVMKLINGMNTVITLANTFKAIMDAAAALSSAGGFFRGLFSILGFAAAPVTGGASLALADGGSVPGSGDGDTVPAMLTPGEFVIRKSVVQRFGSGFFSSLNGGLFPAIAQRYASGGLVSPAAQAAAGGDRTINVYVGDEKVARVVDKANKRIVSDNNYFGV